MCRTFLFLFEIKNDLKKKPLTNTHWSFVSINRSKKKKNRKEGRKGNIFMLRKQNNEQWEKGV